MTISMDTYDRALGAVLGALVGDALGGVLEFLDHKPSAKEVEQALDMPGGGVFELAPGQFTDDGEMTIALLNALLVRRKYDVNLAAKSYIEWANSKPFDIGTATQNALLEADPSECTGESVAKAANDFNSFSQANGCLMRVSPLAVTGSTYNYRSPHIWKPFQLDARLTHPHENCVAATAIYGSTISELIINGNNAFVGVSDQNEFLDQIPFKRSDCEPNEWLADVSRGELPYTREKIGWVKIGFSLAFHHLLNGSTFTAAMRQTLLLGGDTDTNACIVGAMVGARQGASGIPQEWRDAVLRCDTSKGTQPRPALYSAKDLELKIKHLLYMA
ncbi:ADP-ribosylglycohydrolase family protein [Limnohabitans sp.]